MFSAHGPFLSQYHFLTVKMNHALTPQRASFNLLCVVEGCLASCQTHVLSARAHRLQLLSSPTPPLVGLTLWLKHLSLECGQVT